MGVRACRFIRHGLAFAYRDVGDGAPFIFQHGLGGDAAQAFALAGPPTGVRMVTLECRGHGATPLGPLERLRFDALADDVVALMSYLGIRSAVMGGISMGVGVTLNLACRYPDRVRALALVRPAWLDSPMPENLRALTIVAQLLGGHGPERGQAIFRASAIYQELVRSAPDAAASLLRQFEHPRAVETRAKLDRIPRDAPIRSLADLRRCNVPALVLLNHQDPLHPFDLGLALARALPQAQVREIPAKSESPDRHQREAQRALAEFLGQHGAAGHQAARSAAG